MDFQAGTLLAQRFQETRQQLRRLWFKLWGACLLVVVCGFLVAWVFVKPAPPRRVVIAAGPQDGAYFAYASQYKTAEATWHHAGSLSHGRLVGKRPVAGNRRTGASGDRARRHDPPANGDRRAGRITGQSVPRAGVGFLSPPEPYSDLTICGTRRSPSAYTTAGRERSRKSC